MAEHNVGIILCSLDHEGLMTERICKYYLATLVNKILCGIKARAVFGNVLDDNDLIVGKSESLLCAFNGVYEVEVIGGCLVVEADNTYLEILCAVSAGSENHAYSREHGNCEHRGKNFFQHFVSPLIFVFLFFI